MIIKRVNYPQLKTFRTFMKLHDFILVLYLAEDHYEAWIENRREVKLAGPNGVLVGVSRTESGAISDLLVQLNSQEWVVKGGLALEMPKFDPMEVVL